MTGAERSIGTSEWRQIGTLARESAVYGFANVATGLIGVVLIPVYARRLPAEDFALVAVLTSLSTLLVIAASLSMENAAHRWFWSTDDPDARGAVFTVWFFTFGLVAIGLTVATALAAPRLSDWLGSPGRGTAVVLAVASVPLRVPFMVGVNWMRANRRPGSVIAVSLVQAIATVGLTLLLVAGEHATVDRALIAQTLAFGFTSLLLLAQARAWWRPRRMNRDLLGQLLRFSLPLLPAGLAAWALALADRTLLKLLSTAVEVNKYQVAVTWALVVGLPVVAFQQAWGPFGLSVAVRADSYKLYWRILILLTYALSSFAVIAGLLAPEAMAIFGSSYRDAALAGAMLGFGQLTVAIFAHTSLYFSIEKRTGPIAMAFLVGAAINVGLSFLLMPEHGANGAAIAMLAAQLAMVLFIAWRTRALERHPHPWISIVVIPIAAGALTTASVELDGLARASIALGSAVCLAVGGLAAIKRTT